MHGIAPDTPRFYVLCPRWTERAKILNTTPFLFHCYMFCSKRLPDKFTPVAWASTTSSWIVLKILMLYYRICGYQCLMAVLTLMCMPGYVVSSPRWSHSTSSSGFIWGSLCWIRLTSTTLHKSSILASEGHALSAMRKIKHTFAQQWDRAVWILSYSCMSTRRQTRSLQWILQINLSRVMAVTTIEQCLEDFFWFTVSACSCCSILLCTQTLC